MTTTASCFYYSLHGDICVPRGGGGGGGAPSLYSSLSFSLFWGFVSTFLCILIIVIVIAIVVVSPDATIVSFVVDVVPLVVCFRLVITM